MSVKTESYRTQEKHESSNGVSQSFLQITSVKSDDTQCLTHYAATGLDTLPLTLFLGYVFLKATHGCHLILLLLH